MLTASLPELGAAAIDFGANARGSSLPSHLTRGFPLQDHVVQFTIKFVLHCRTGKVQWYGHILNLLTDTNRLTC